MYNTNRAEVTKILQEMRNEAASGTDLISVPLLKSLADEMSPVLVRAINKCIRNGDFPTSFKTARLVALYKSGDRKLAGNYRPVAILSNLSKIFEKIIYNRIFIFLQNLNFFNDKQFGFLPKSNTSSAALDAVTTIQMSIDDASYTSAVFIDVSKAFDCVDHGILLQKLLMCGVRGNGYWILRDYLFGRTQIMSSEQGTSTAEFMTNGVPQGSSLSSLLFLIYINDIFELPLRGRLQLYADDAVIIYTSKDFQTLQSDMYHDLTLLYEWFYNNLLTFNVSKTKYMIFAPKNKVIPNPQPLIIKGSEVERVKSARYLGLILDEKLLFTEHVSYVKSKISPYLAMLRKTSRFLPDSTKLSVYYSFIVIS